MVEERNETSVTLVSLCTNNKLGIISLFVQRCVSPDLSVRVCNGHPFPWSHVFPAELCLGLSVTTPSVSGDQRGDTGTRQGG